MEVQTPTDETDIVLGSMPRLGIGAGNESEHRVKSPSCTCHKTGRNLVVCIDGTSNHFAQKSTNVMEMYQNLVKDDNQVACYINGTGTFTRPSWMSLSFWKQTLSHTADLAFAWKFKGTIISAYDWLSENHTEGDRIFLFGFSRGAYEVRALSAMIDKVGLVHKGNRDQIPLAYKLYTRSEKQGTQSTAMNDDFEKVQRKPGATPPNSADSFKRTFSRTVTVHFVGAWETVSSIGAIRRKAVPGTTDSMNVCFFRHALALDERRVKYLSTHPESDKHDTSKHHTKEVWFDGTHYDLGGKHNKDTTMELGKPSLLWMYREAQSVGLRLSNTDARLNWSPHDSVCKSPTSPEGAFRDMSMKRLSRKVVRNTTAFITRSAGRQIQLGQKIHPTVFFPSESCKPGVLPPTLRNSINPTPCLGESSQSDSIAQWSSWIDMDFHDIARAIIKHFEGLPTNPVSGARALKRLLSVDEGVSALREIPEATDSLLFAWENLCEKDFEIARDAIRDALGKTEQTIDNFSRYAAQTAGVTSTAISPDGTLIVSGSMDRSVGIWDAITGHLIASFEKHSAPVTSAAFSYDGTKIVSGSWDQTVIIWDVANADITGKPFKGHTNRVTCVTFSPDAKFVVSASVDQTIRLWDIQTGGILRILEQPYSINSVAFSPDGTCLVSASLDRTIRIWNAKAGHPTDQMFSGHAGSVTCVAFSPDGQRIVSGSVDQTIRVWDVPSGTLRTSLQGHAGAITSVAFSPDEKHIVSGSSDRTVRVWEVDAGVAVGDPFKGHNGYVTSVMFTPGERHLMSSSLDGTMKFWRAYPFIGHQDSVNCIAFSQDGRRIVTGSGDKTIRIWDAETGDAIGKPLQGHTNAIYSIAFSPNGKRIVSGSGSVDRTMPGVDRTIRVWDMATGEVVGKPFGGHRDDVNCVAYSADAKYVVSGAGDRTIRFWNARTGEGIGKPLHGHRSGVFSIAYTPDGKRIFSASWDGAILAWDAAGAAAGGVVCKPFIGRARLASCIAYSPDGARAVSGSEDGTLRLWDTERGEAVDEAWQGHRGPVSCVAFSPDGTRFVSGSEDQTVREWNASTGEGIGQPLEGHGMAVYSIAISPDGKRMVSGSKDGFINVWVREEGESTGALSAGWQPHSACVESIDTVSQKSLKRN